MISVAREDHLGISKGEGLGGFIERVDAAISNSIRVLQLPFS